ncbi:MAG: cyclophilin-like fold protein, partial [Burkholderiales bacterium]
MTRSRIVLASVLIATLRLPILVGQPATAAEAATTRAQQARSMKIRIDVNGTPVTATLDDNETSRDFVSLLPLTLTLEDYNSTEKISNLPKKLSTKDAPAGINPSVGDIAYYAPWGNLAIFYKDFGYSRGLVKLGHIDSPADVFHRP